MGKAIIESEQGAGEYTATVIYDTERAEKEVATLSQTINEIDTELAAVNTELFIKQSEINAIQNELDAAIISGSEPDALFQIVEKLAEPTAEAAKIRNKKNGLTAEKLAARKRVKFIQDNTPVAETLTVWSADYSEGLSGEVGTIEPNGTLEAAPIIYPHQIEGSAHNPARDNQIQPIVSSGAPAVYFNRALLPAWQKWLPTYRVGAITSKSGDLCTVLLDNASGQQQLNINQAALLTSVPIEYMRNNGLVFEVGDRVVVKFENQDWTQPKVIGFEDHPKPEETLYLLNDCYFSGDTSQINRHDLNGAWQEQRYDGDLGGFSSRNLERSGTDLYFFYYKGGGDTDGKIFRLAANGSLNLMVLDCDNKFCVNSDHVFYHVQDWDIYSRQIKIIDRKTAAFVGSFDVDIPNVSVYEEMRPEWVGCNDQYFYWWMEDDYTSDNPTTYICRSDLNGQNQEVVSTWPPPNMPALTNGSSSWRGLHVTKDRIYIPWGRVSTNDPNEVVPIVCYVYDLDFNYIASFGGLTRATGTGWTGGDYMRGFAANERTCVWLADLHNGQSFTQVWDRVLTYNGNGDLVTEEFVARPQSAVNLDNYYTGILGGICL